MGAGYVIKCAVTKILQAAGDARGGMILHSRYVNNFRQRVGDNTGHIGTGFPLAEKIGLAIDIRIVARGVDKSVLYTHYANSGRKQRLIAAYVNLVCIAVVHDDVASRNSDGLNPTDNRPHDLRR